jgi:hypothetical protein
MKYLKEHCLTPDFVRIKDVHMRLNEHIVISNKNNKINTDTHMRLIEHIAKYDKNIEVSTKINANRLAEEIELKQTIRHNRTAIDNLKILMFNINSFQQLTLRLEKEIHTFLNVYEFCPSNDAENELVNNIRNTFATRKVVTFQQYKNIMDTFLVIEEDYENDADNQTLEDSLGYLLHVIQDLPCKDTTSHLSQQSSQARTLTPFNILEESINFYKTNNLTSLDIMDTVKEMLDSKQYILSESFMSSKLNFEDVNTLFMSAIAPKDVKRDDLQKLLFKSVVCDNLI